MDIGRMVRITAGSTLLMAGAVMLVLPGPGLLTIAAGLSVLAKDVPAAARMKARVRARFSPNQRLGEGSCRPTKEAGR